MERLRITMPYTSAMPSARQKKRPATKVLKSKFSVDFVVVPAIDNVSQQRVPGSVGPGALVASGKAS
jgi:hypothetical protein